MRWVLVLLAIVGVGVGIIFFNAEQIDSPADRTTTAKRPPGETAAPTPSPAKSAPETPTLLPARSRFTLFFASPDGRGLKPEPRDVPRRLTLRTTIWQVLEELIQGPRAGLVETLPRATRILEIFLDGQGTAYIDFSKEISTAHPGGGWAEASTVASIVQTLTVNFEAIRKVAILIEGKSVETLAGHVDIRRPLTRLDIRPFLLAAGAPSSPPRPQ